MIKQIIWDFDGVIVFSDEIREFGFKEVLKEYHPSIIDGFLQFHRTNGGLSRYVKFRFMFEQLLEQTPNENEILKLANQFSAIMQKKMINTDILNIEVVNFIRDKQKSVKHHIASGSDGNELNYLCSELGIHSLFNSILGSPTPKSELVKQIVASNGSNNEEFCLIGDALNDYEAAKLNGIAFYGYNNPNLSKFGILLETIKELPI